MLWKSGAVYLSLILGLQVFSCQNAEHTADKQENPQKTDEAADVSPEANLEQIRDDLKTVKAQLAKEGKYNCCVQPACDWCALHEGECPCHENLKAGKSVCPGCGLGWHDGNGVVPGVEADEVQWDITHEHAAGGHSH